MPLSRMAARLGSAAATAAGVLLLVFIILRATPGDPADLMLGESASSASRQALRESLGLNQPLWTQLALFAKDLTQGELGQSVTQRKPVSTLIARTLPLTVLLALAASVIANILGVTLGTLAASRAGSATGRVIFGLSILLVSLPVFWLGPLLVAAFALRWPWLPVSSFREASGIVLPALSMGLALSGQLIQTARASVLEILRSDFIRTARAKGAPEARVLYRHALPVAAVPVITVSLLQFGHLLAGAVIVETIFDWPGMGRLLYEALLTRDYPTVQGVVLITTLIYVAINTLTDLLTARYSPG